MMTENSNLPKKILVVDNDQGICNAIEQGLKSYNINVLKAIDWESALYQFNNNKFDLCVVSLELENMFGTALIQKWRQHSVVSKRNTAFIISSGISRNNGDEALIKEIDDVGLITKPIKIPALLSAMANALKTSAQRDNLQKTQELVIQPMIKQKQFYLAIEMAKEKLSPTGPKGKFQTALIQDQAQAPEEALLTLAELTATDNNNMKYHNEIARIHLGMGNLEKARAAYELADKAAPHNIARITDMANMYLKLKEPDKSMEKFKQLIKLNPENPEMKYSCYDELFKAGYLLHAQTLCKETSTPRELIRHFNNKGVIFSKEKDYISAIDAYKKATMLIPGNRELFRILFNMAIAHINLKTPENLEKAHVLLLECLKLEPKFDKAREKLKITEKFSSSLVKGIKSSL